MRWKWLVALLPLGLGLVVAGLAVSGRLPNHLLYLQGDLATLSWLVGLLFSALAIGYLLLLTRAERDRQRDVVQVQEQAADERRRFLRRTQESPDRDPGRAGEPGLGVLGGGSRRGLEQRGSPGAAPQSSGRRPAQAGRVGDPSPGTHVGEHGRLAARGSGNRSGTSGRGRAPPETHCAAGTLAAAVHNLVDNALKFTAPGDTVEIRAFEDGATVVIEVADTGPGIPEEEMPHVWEELYRGQGARGVQGSGLGLALVQAIVERHCGQTGLRSRAGQGTVFTLRLPLQ